MAPGPQIVIMKKTGEMHNSTLPADGLPALYKRCGFKKPEGFAIRCNWALPGARGEPNIFVRVYGKIEGRAGSENKGELPPPIDTLLFFGNLAIVAYAGANDASAVPTGISVERVEELFNLLVGGIEDITETDDEEEEEEEGTGPPLTADGYEKDGFVVEDSEASDVEGDSTDEEDELSADECEATGETACEDVDDAASAGPAPPAAQLGFAEEDVGPGELTCEQYDTE